MLLHVQLYVVLSIKIPSLLISTNSYLNTRKNYGRKCGI